MPPVSGIINPLIVAPADDAAVSRKQTKKITGARELTAEDYTEKIKECKKKDEENKRRGSCSGLERNLVERVEGGGVEEASNHPGL